MTRGMPSMTALLGLLAIAGYQNREKIAEMLGKLNTSNAPAGGGQTSEVQPSGSDGIFGNLGGLLSGTSLGSVLSGGLSELSQRFQQNGYGDAAESWIGKGENKHLPEPDLEKAIGPDVLDTLSKQTGLSRDQILARLSQDLPGAVDRYTPDGRLPAPDPA